MTVCTHCINNAMHTVDNQVDETIVDVGTPRITNNAYNGQTGGLKLQLLYAPLATTIMHTTDKQVS